MFNYEEFKRKLEKWLQNHPNCTLDEIKNCYRTILSKKDYLQNKWIVDDIINWYATIYLEKTIEKQWYSTIDFGNGEITNGIFDHRPVLKYYGFPESLKGKRVLDVGCADGFFSFEFEKRGADKVVALDAYKSDLFLLAKEKLNSKVEYCLMDVYDISPDKIGYFDFVFCGALLIHLSDPFRALRNIRSVIKKGEFICSTIICKKPIEYFFSFLNFLGGGKFLASLLIPKRPEIGSVSGYWIPTTTDCLIKMLYKSGFDKVKKQGTFTLKGYYKAMKRKEIHYNIVVRADVE
jgi:tRNA (mo5U34)-methyltransferase